MIHCPSCEHPCPDETVTCPDCGHRLASAQSRSPKPPPCDPQPAKPSPSKLPWEVGAFRVVGNLVFIVAGCLLVGGLFAGVGTIRGEPNAVIMVWSVPVAVVGLLFRAIAGVWSALERIAAREKSS